MHSIKKAARREAWYHNNDPDSRTYNLWGRWKPNNSNTRDIENNPHLEHHNTEDAASSPIAEARRRSNQQDREGFGGPKKSATDRPGSGGFLDPSSAAEQGDAAVISGSEDSNKDSTDKSNPATEKEAERLEPIDTSNTNGGMGAGTGGLRKRDRARKFLPWKRSKDADNADLEREETKDSKKKNWPKPTFMGQFKAVFGSWINLLLVFVPVGIVLEYVHVNKVVVFVLNFIAIIPLAAMLSFATEELALYIGEVLGGLLNATFGNAVELIVGIIALNQGQILIVQTSLIGSMLSNLLLVMGMCFFFGGLRRVEQFFNVTVAQTAASLLALAIGSLIIPTAFQIFAPKNNGPVQVAPPSRGTAVLLLVTYGCYLFFQLRTHVDMYNEPSQKSPKKSSGKKDTGEAIKGLATAGANIGAASGGQIQSENPVQEEEEEGEVPQLSRLGALVTLAGSTVLIALCAEFMVSAIGEVAKSVSPEFIGLILLPIVGNAAEHATAVTVAIKDKMDLAIGVAIGSSLQIALLVLPLMVLLNWWGVGQAPDVKLMTLDFDGFQVSVLFIAIIVVNYLIQDGKSHWLEGVLLQITYLIIALSAWFYPASEAVAG